MTVTHFRIAAIVAGCLVVYLTLGPVGIRSMSPLAPQVDRMLAFVLIGGLAVLSAPRRPWLGALLVLAMVVGLELAQWLTADRHGRMLDSIEKLLGAGLGIGAAYLLRWLRRRGPAA